MSGLNPNTHKGKKKYPKVAATDNSGSASSSASSPKKHNAKPNKPESGAAKAGSNTGRKKEPEQQYTSTAVGSSSGQTKHERMRGPPKQNYSLGDIIGEGSYTVVYECSDPEGGYYAVKTLKPKYENDKRTKEMEAREEEILIFLRDHPERHKSIVEFRESYDEPDVNEKKLRTYFVFEVLNGRSLASTLRPGPIKNVDKIKRVSVQALEGLQFLHKNNIVHCDIKPENILFKTDDPRDYTIKIIDFGFSQRGPAYSKEILGGTPIYYPPEVFGHEGLVSPKLDIWGFGVVLYEMFHGLDKFTIRPMSYAIAMKRKKNQLSNARKYMKEYNEKEFEQEVEFDTDEWKSNPQAVRLAKGILDKDHNKRLTAEEALGIQWLKE